MRFFRSGCLAFIAGVWATTGGAGAYASANTPVTYDRHAKPRRLSVDTYGLGQWRLRVKQDSFFQEKHCTISYLRGKAAYRPDAVGFRFGRHAAILDAVARIDGGQPIRFRDLLPELARLGVAIEGHDVASFSDGLVWLPITLLDSAHEVTIAVGFGKPIKRFDVEGLDRLSAYARSEGCVMTGWLPE